MSARISPGTSAMDLADELDRRLDAYLSSLDGGQNQAVNEVALRNALWDNKAGIIARLRAGPAQAAPEGWRLVPIEPTQEMIAAAEDARETYAGYCYRDMFTEMVKAAPAYLVTSTQQRPFYGAECPSYPNCNGGCGLGCTKKIEAQLSSKVHSGDGR